MGRQSVTSTTTIDAPVDVVFGITTDPDTCVEGYDWIYGAEREYEGPMTLGSVYIEDAKPGPKRGMYRWEVTAFDPPHRIVTSHDSKEMVADLEVTCEPVGADSTRYTQTMRYRAVPGFRPLGWLLERTVMKRKMQRDFDRMVLPNFKRIVEERHGVPGA